MPSGSASSDRICPESSLAIGRGLVAVLADLEELALGPGADDQAIVDPGQGVDQRLEPEDFTGNSVGVEPVDGIVARGDRLGRGRATLGRPAGRGRACAGGRGCGPCTGRPSTLVVASTRRHDPPPPSERGPVQELRARRLAPGTSSSRLVVPPPASAAVPA